MRIRWTKLAAVGGLALMGACTQPAAEPPAAPPTAVVSVLRSAPEFAACAWQEVKGAKLAIQAFACGPEQGGQHIEADDSLPGFQLVYDGPPTERRPVVRTFAKPADAPLEAILPAIRAASPGPHAATCAFAPAQGYDDKDKGRFVLEPTGAAKASWEASLAVEPGDPPCGPMGVSAAGNRYFKVMPSHPDLVVYADVGSEIQIFDPETLRVIAP
ncbi:MAG: hypothetical protein Q8K11_03530 [Phenylobacterium sp.]|uniref:hypothetical protein n=1 Tax=Phenylobacterium sp. TaxID=1871053 RepID=UPI0027306419|nr:hypothetical protein [Phenylobacterium sp.]MDP2009229.1 hypothetical protein [Phenylobacterium sp.]